MKGNFFPRRSPNEKVKLGILETSVHIAKVFLTVSIWSSKTRPAENHDMLKVIVCTSKKGYELGQVTRTHRLVELECSPEGTADLFVAGITDCFGILDQALEHSSSLLVLLLNVTNTHLYTKAL